MMEVGLLVRSKENCMEVDSVPESGSESCRCSELEERSRSAEAKCLELERRNELLRKRVEELEKEKLRFVNELKVSKRGNGELTTEGGVYLDEDEDEDDVFRLNQKCDGAISCDSIPEPAGEFHEPGSRKGTPYIGTPCIVEEDGRLGSRCQLKLGKVRKRLALQEDGKCSKKLAPSTPCVARPASSLIIIFDSDDEPELACRKMRPENGKWTTDSLLEETRKTETEIKDVKCQNSNDIEDSLDDFAPSSLTPRRGRRRVRKIVTSESESEDDAPISELFKPHIQIEHSDDTSSKLLNNHLDLADDDNVPISELLNSHIQKEHSGDASSKLHAKSVDPTLPGLEKSCNSSRIEKRRRLVRTREIQGNSASLNDPSNCCRGIPDTEEIEDGSSENEDSSMDDFIVEVDSSEEDVQDGDSGSEQVDAAEDSGAKTDNALKNVSDDDETYPEIISRFRRKKVNKSEWESEADMLAAFSESPELCMRAVCALYRKQTDDERASKETIYQNGRGFSQPDANRGSTLGDFLLGGDPTSDLQKTVEDLKARFHGGVELCRELARRYSKQLFDIYRMSEDPHFHPVIPDAEV